MVSEEQTKLEMLAITRLSLILMPVLMVLALLGGYGIAGRMLRPVRKISETAEEIGSGNDLKKRIDVGEGQDELHLQKKKIRRKRPLPLLQIRKKGQLGRRSHPSPTLRLQWIKQRNRKKPMSASTAQKRLQSVMQA